MKRFFAVLTCLFIGLNITACSHIWDTNRALSKLTITPTIGETTKVGTPIDPTATIEPVTPTATFTPEPTVVTESSNNPKYNLKVDFNYQAMTADIIESVDFSNPIDKPLTQLVFIVEPDRYPNGFELINAAVIDSSTQLSYSIQGNQLRIDIDPALLPGETIHLSFEYKLKLPAIPPPSEVYKPQPYGYTDKQANLVDWYLFAFRFRS
jgi:hypothetical protein